MREHTNESVNCGNVKQQPFQYVWPNVVFFTQHWLVGGSWKWSTVLKSTRRLMEPSQLCLYHPLDAETQAARVETNVASASSLSCLSKRVWTETGGWKLEVVTNVSGNSLPVVEQCLYFAKNIENWNPVVQFESSWPVVSDATFAHRCHPGWEGLSQLLVICKWFWVRMNHPNTTVIVWKNKHKQ